MLQRVIMCRRLLVQGIERLRWRSRYSRGSHDQVLVVLLRCLWCLLAVLLQVAAVGVVGLLLRLRSRWARRLQRPSSSRSI